MSPDFFPCFAVLHRTAVALLAIASVMLLTVPIAAQEIPEHERSRRKAMMRNERAPVVKEQDRPEYVPRVVVVQFAPEVFVVNKTSATGLQEFDRRAGQYGVYLIERVYPFLDYVEPTPKTRRNLMALRRTYYVRYSAGAAPKQVAGDLAAAPGVAYAEPVPVNRTQAHWKRVDPDDPKFGDQPELNLLRLPQAWDAVKGESGAPRAVIAIVDSGGEWRHEDLRANVWTNPGEIAGNGIDDDRNGFIDDVHGVNFENGDETNNDPTGLSALHGTAVAGSASAVTDNGVGVAGAAWNAELMHVTVGCGADSDAICNGYEGILYAAANGADIINASWGGPAGTDDEIRLADQTLDLATDLGALVVAAASNNGLSIDLFRFYPARNPRVLSVGATEKDTRRRAEFSNYGKLVNVFAPGTSILTTETDNSYGHINGTSFSSPLTAGVAALVKTRFPDMGPDALREHIRLASDNMDAENPDLAGELGRGFVNALAAIREPALPAVRLKRWSWTDDDGDRQIASGDAVTVTTTVVNYLSDARQLSVGLTGTEPYPFIDMTGAEADVGYLASGDSVEVRLEFTVATDAPENQRVRFYTHIRDGAFEDGADQLSFRVNWSLEVVHWSLSALYAATGGDDWTHNDNWDITRVPTEEELGAWHGVGLNEGWLALLELPENNLTGQLPPELADLTELQWLILRDNHLTGQLPPELADLTELQWLILWNNTLTGPIPPEFGNFPKLQILDLENNSLTGPIPPEFGNLSQLEELWLNDNALSGPIPPELGNLSQLKLLALYDNALSGPIPPELGNLSQLTDLRLDVNSLTGPMPAEIGNLSQLEYLRLDRNSLTGPIPPEIGNLSQLEYLRLDRNSLTGPIPPELGNLSQLGLLRLGGNSLTGPIPPELGNLSQLEYLRLDVNSLTGPIPAELGNLSQLGLLRLGGNSLTGPIPAELGNLSQLGQLRLGGNSLTGPIPPELGNLSQLHDLQLDNNSLSGPIPPELGNLSQLHDLQLDNNSLSGPIPPELGDLPRLKSLDLRNNALTGVLPRNLMQLDSLETFQFGGQDLCAPGDDAFQAWVSSIPNVGGPTCTGMHFAGGIEDQTFAVGATIPDVVLPEAIGGTPPYTYTLAPTLPAGLSFDASARTIGGAPTVIPATPVTYTYKAADANGAADSLLFAIEVVASVHAENETLPESFALRGNYPNPFRRSTRLVFDLPGSAYVTVEVIDVTGRRVLMTPPVDMASGREHSIELNGATLPSGLYLYRLIATSPEGVSTQVGRLVHIR